MRFNCLSSMQSPHAATVVLYLKSSQAWLHISVFRLKILYKRCLSKLEELLLVSGSGLHSSNSLLQQSILNLSKESAFISSHPAYFWGLEEDWKTLISKE